MKSRKIRILGMLILLGQLFFIYNSFAGDNKSIASQLNIYIFPQNGQDSEKQEYDEYQSYKWAVDQTGVNPLYPPEIEAEQIDTSPDGSAIRGSARGAATGAAIGAIAGDAGKGAAIGATAGAIRGKRAKNYHDFKAQEEANTEAQTANEEMMNNFKKAFAAAMEGKGYTVKY